MREDEMPYPWPEPEGTYSVYDAPAPTGETYSRAERKARRYVGPTGGVLTDPAAVEGMRKAKRAQRDARRRNRR